MKTKKRVVVGTEAINARIQRMLIARAKYEADLPNAHVKLMKGNSKTGANCYTVSLCPIIDCVNCSECRKDCYDIQHDVIYKQVVDSRACNSAICRKDKPRYWAEISQQVKALFVTELRLNVGGDLDDEDFAFVSLVAEENPRCDILFFTKNYKGINTYLENHKFPQNVKAIMSAWKGMPMDNPHNLPVAHVLWEDGTTTAPEYGSYYCGGNCSACHFNAEGCWTLKNGESVIFKAH